MRNYCVSFFSVPFCFSLFLWMPLISIKKYVVIATTQTLINASKRSPVIQFTLIRKIHFQRIRRREKYGVSVIHSYISINARRLTGLRKIQAGWISEEGERRRISLSRTGTSSFLPRKKNVRQELFAIRIRQGSPSDTFAISRIVSGETIHVAEEESYFKRILRNIKEIRPIEIQN